MRRALMSAMVVALLLWCAPAAAATWESGEPALSGGLVYESGAFRLPWTILWQQGPVIAGAPLDPRSVERLPNGNTLVASRDSRAVYEVTPAGRLAWSFTTASDPDLTPFSAAATPQGNVLIVDRWQETVFEVDRSGTIVWRYGIPDSPMTQSDDDTQTPDPGELIDPFQAIRLPNGNTLIAENQAGRVIEVRSADYSPGAPDDGYTAASIVWSYTAPGWPKYAQRLANGNTLIADEAANLVLEVTPGGAVAWSYDGAVEPASAERLADGSTLITDGGNDRAIRVARDGTILWEYSTSSLLGITDLGLAGPRRASPTPTGSILIADEGHDRLLELGYPSEAAAESAVLDVGLPGARKRFTALEPLAELPAGTGVRVAYSIDGGAWQALSGSSLPADTFGTTIRYRVTLSSSRHDVTPRLSGVRIAYDPAPTQASGSGTTGIGTGTGTGPGGGSGGTMAAGSGYGSGEQVLTDAWLPGLLSNQRGFAMANIGTDIGPGSPGAIDAATPELGGLLLLGVLYALGLAYPFAETSVCRLVRPLRDRPFTR